MASFHRIALLMVAAILGIEASIYTDYYCPINANHTMCIHQGIGPRCGHGSYGGYLTEEEKKTIVDTHNILRMRIANGQEHQGAPGPQPPASDMQLLQWDDELANIAQMWADQCYFEHDLNRDTSRFNVGQNLFQSEGGVPWNEAIYSWYSEVQYFDKNLVDYFLNDKITDHFSQLVWGNTRYVGCGKRTYPQRRYKREADPEAVDESNLRIDEDGDQENLRQPRRIYSGQYTNNRVNNNYERNNYNWNHYEESYDSQLRAYNATLQQYLEKYKNNLQHKGDYSKQLDQYGKYLEQLHRSGWGTYEDKVRQFSDLQKKYETYKNIHERQIYYEKKLKTMQASKKKLNPVISTHYDFVTPYPIISGIVYEYYVCNYGPAGNYPGARMYTKGQNKCNGLCQDPMTELFYPSLEIQNDPILSELYSRRRK